MIFSPVS